MKVVDLYNLPESEIGQLIRSMEGKTDKLEAIVDDAERLIYNLNSLIQSFPNSGSTQKFEIKIVVLKLQRLVNEIKNVNVNPNFVDYGELRLVNSRRVL